MPRRRKISLLFFFLIEPNSFQRRASEMVRRTLCGVIQCANDQCILNSDDIVIITLCDITSWELSRIDFPHIPRRFVISNIKLDDCDFFPIPFTLYYNEEEIDRNLSYGIRCDIINKDEEVKYSSEQFIPVLTDKHPKTNVHITVAPISVE